MGDPESCSEGYYPAALLQEEAKCLESTGETRGRRWSRS
jgi:hypothetical protein